MSSLRLSTICLLTLSIPASIYCIITLQIFSGTFELLNSLGSKTPHLLPGTNAVLRTTYSHFWLLDAQLSGLIPFFWPLVVGALPELSLFGVYMGGQLVASEVLILIEGERAGNKGGIMQYSTVWGLLWQNIPWGLVQPVYNLVHLFRSPIGRPEVPLNVDTISVNPRRILLLPLSVILGYIIPSIIICLPSPHFFSHYTHQGLLAAWQFFPLWIGLSHLLLTTVISDAQITRFLSNPAYPYKRSLSALRCTYTFALAVSGFTHLLILAIVLFHNSFESYLPAIFNPATPSQILIPTSPFSSAKVDLLEDGILNLLQYDTLFAGGTSLTWALYLYFRAASQATFVSMVGKPLLLTALLGPCGAALAVIWERDEKVFAGSRRSVGSKKLR